MTEPDKPRKRTAAKKAATVVKAEPLPAEPTAPAAEPHAVPDPNPEREPESEQMPPGAVRVPLGDGSVVVLDQDDWPSSALQAALERRFNTWATKALATEADVAFWLAVDPTLRQVDEFMRHYNEARGVVIDKRAIRRSMLTLTG